MGFRRVRFLVLNCFYYMGCGGIYSLGREGWGLGRGRDEAGWNIVGSVDGLVGIMVIRFFE